MQDKTIYPLKNFELQGDTMQQPAGVNRILALRSIEWGAKKIAKERGISRGTAKKQIKLGDWRPSKAKSRV